MLMDTIWWFLPFGIHVNTASELIVCAWFRSFLEVLFDSLKCKILSSPNNHWTKNWLALSREWGKYYSPTTTMILTSFPENSLLSLYRQNKWFPVWWCWCNSPIRWKSQTWCFVPPSGGETSIPGTGEARSEERHPKMHSFASLGTTPGGAVWEKKEQKNSTHSSLGMEGEKCGCLLWTVLLFCFLVWVLRRMVWMLVVFF